MKVRYIIIGVVVIAIAALIYSYRESRPMQIKIGYVGPLSGPLGVSTGESVREALELAQKKKSVVHGKQIVLIEEDDACDAKKAVSATEKLIAVDRVDVLITMCSGSMLAMAPIAEAYKIVLISPVTGAPSITNAGDYIFRLSASSVASGGAAAEFARAHGYKKAAILFEQNEFPIGWKDSFIKTFTENDPTRSVATESATIGSTDVKTQLLKLQLTKPDVLVIATLTAPMANAALKQARELSFNVSILGNETFSLKAVTKLGLADGVMASVYKYGETSALMEFNQAYAATFQHPVQEEIYAALAYDTYQVLYDAFAACGNTNSDCLKNYLYSVKSRTGLSGTFSIDKNGDTERKFVMKEVRGDQLIEVR